MIKQKDIVKNDLLTNYMPAISESLKRDLDEALTQYRKYPESAVDGKKFFRDFRKSLLHV